MKIIELVKKSMKSKTLLTDMFGSGLIVTGFADKYLAGQVTMYKSFKWLEKKYQKDVRVKKKLKSEENIQKEYVWFCWLQGIENAPKLVQDCYASIKYWLKDKEIIVITESNYKEYVEFPDYIIEKWKKGIITHTHFSDLLRIELLINHGGLWLDATTYLTGTLPNYISENDFFVYRNGWMDMEMINMGSWLISSKKTNNFLLVETRRLLYKYWEKNNFMKNYFLMHMFFRMVTDKNQEEWEKVPMVNHIDSHYMMQELSKEYNLNRCLEIVNLTPVHKLTYKFVKNDNEITVADKLGELYKIGIQKWNRK